MKGRRDVRAVLFDSGDTLIRPIAGRWNPRFDFEEVLLRHVPDAPAELFPAAFSEGQRFLEAAPWTPDRDDYHRVILRVLGIDNPSDRLLLELNRPLETPVLEPFPEVPSVLRRLQALGVRMVIVSDSWPELETTYVQLGLHKYFDAFVISAVLGCNKPDPRMYQAGSDALGLAPEQCLFVDDGPELVAAAIDLGYQGVAVCRNEPCPRDDVPWISRLDDLVPLVAGA